MTKEEIWLNRLKKYIIDFKEDGVCSWWLRLEYDDENVSTSTINYYLKNQSVKAY